MPQKLTSSLPGLSVPLGIPEPKPADEKGVNLYSQLLLVASLIGIELIATFGQIYEVLFLQFLDVPNNLITVNGVITGCLSLVLLPTVGWVSDNGSNPLSRKLLMMSIVLLVIVISLISYIACGFLKLAYLDDVSDIRDRMNCTNSNHAFSNVSTNKTSSLNINRIGEPAAFSCLSLPPVSPYRIALAILSAAFLDVGFDTGILVCRSFILECVPAFQHTRILVLATTVQSFAGTAFALLNTFNFPYFLGHVFGVDGTAVSVVFLSAFLAFVEICGFGCSMITGFVLGRRRQDTNSAASQSPGSLPDREGIPDNPSDYRTKRSTWWRQIGFKRKSRFRPLAEEAEDENRPLILKTRIENSDYSALHGNHDINNAPYHSQGRDVNENKTSDNREDNNLGLAASNSKTVSDMTEHELSDQNAPEHGVMRASSYDSLTSLEKTVSDGPLLISDAEEIPESQIDKISSTVVDVIKASCSISVSPDQHLTTDTNSRHKMMAGITTRNEIGTKMKTQSQSSFFSKPLVTLVSSSFFANGSMIACIIFLSNALTIGIIHGDPHALSGSEGNLLYWKGIRTSAWGIVSMYISFAATSLATNKLVDIIGEKLQYTLTHVVFLASLVGLLVVKTTGFYFLVMVLAGMQRVCVYTLSYIMANKFEEERASKVAIDKSPHSPKNTDKVMALIAINLPLHSVLISCAMGPLMAASGSPWVPIQYAMVVTGISLLTSLLLFIFKKL